MRFAYSTIFSSTLHFADKLAFHYFIAQTKLNALYIDKF